MAVKQLSKVSSRYFGLAGDTKPTNVPIGSTYYATDTDATTVFDGTSWVDEPGLIEGGGGGTGSPGSAGTEYTEGAIDTSITGVAMMYETNISTSALGVVNTLNPLPVSDNGTALRIQDGGGSISVDDNNLSLTVDGAVSTNPITGQTGVQGGSGLVSANTQRMVLATDVALPAGTNAIGKLAANAGVDIGDVGAKSYPAPAVGELAGSATAVQMPTVACKLVKFKASYDNVGRVYLGIAGVTVANGTTDTTTGLQLSAGEETGWIPVDNLNRFYRICDNAGDDLTYLALN